jgi:phage repressor protein C with HTH and peptisase S24 domain
LSGAAARATLRVSCDAGHAKREWATGQGLADRPIQPLTCDDIVVSKRTTNLGVTMNLGGRLKRALSMAGIPPAGAARQAKVPIASLNALFRRDSRRSQYADKVLDIIPDGKVNKDWVRTGKGSPDPTLILGQHGPRLIRAWDHQGVLPAGTPVLVPKLDVTPSSAEAEAAGSKAVLLKEKAHVFDGDWLRHDRMQLAALGWMQALNDGMEPVICRRDKYVVDTSQVDVVDGATFCVHFDGLGSARRLFKLPGGGLRLKCDNVVHPLIDLTQAQANAVDILGRVVHRAGAGGL